jgi:hypothetical protein
MTTYGTSEARVVGQPISPNFGAQNGQCGSGGGVVGLPPNMTLMEAMSRGILPMNQYLTAVNGQNVGPNDPCSVLEAISNGNGECTARGASIAVNANQINNQIFVDGINTLVACSATGPAPTDTSSIVEAPVSAATTGAGVTLTAGNFAG